MFRERLRSWERNFHDYVEKLCRDPNVLEAYLVGSRARGNHLPYSDYDVAVVVRNGLDKLTEAERLRRLREKPFPLDLIFVWESELGDPIYAKMLENAKPLCRGGEREHG